MYNYVKKMLFFDTRVLHFFQIGCSQDNQTKSIYIVKSELITSISGILYLDNFTKDIHEFLNHKCCNSKNILKSYLFSFPFVDDVILVQYYNENMLNLLYELVRFFVSPSRSVLNFFI